MRHGNSCSADIADHIGECWCCHQLTYGLVAGSVSAHVTWGLSQPPVRGSADNWEITAWDCYFQLNRYFVMENKISRTFWNGHLGFWLVQDVYATQINENAAIRLAIDRTTQCGTSSVEKKICNTLMPCCQNMLMMGKHAIFRMLWFSDSMLYIWFMLSKH